MYSVVCSMWGWGLRVWKFFPHWEGIVVNNVIFYLNDKRRDCEYGVEGDTATQIRASRDDDRKITLY